VGWQPEQYAAASLDCGAEKNGDARLGRTGMRSSRTRPWEIIVEATGNPIAAVEHALAAFRNGKHVVMVTVEADAFCGPLLAKKPRRRASCTA